MKSVLAGVVLAASLLLLQASAALARPPTVMNSPGYEARLAESRKAAAERRAVEERRLLEIQQNNKPKSKSPPQSR